MREEVILVDENDRQRGVMEKLEAHRKGVLHRAVSVFIFNSSGEMLLQRRAAGKYHSGGLLTNACCSHPRPGETAAAAAARRLKEEMGIETPLDFKGTFTYRAEFENGLTEHELDHVFEGTTDAAPRPHPEEAEGYVFMKADELFRAVHDSPERFTPWFRIALARFYWSKSSS